MYIFLNMESLFVVSMLLFVEPWLLSSEAAEYCLIVLAICPWNSRGHDLLMSRAGDIKEIYSADPILGVRLVDVPVGEHLCEKLRIF